MQYGLAAIKNVGISAVEAIVEARENVGVHFPLPGIVEKWIIVASISEFLNT